METILIARERETGKDVVLAGREVPYPQQRDLYREFASPIHERFSNVALVYVTPCKKPLKLISQDEHDARARQQKAMEEATKPAPKKQPRKKNQPAD